MKNYDENPIVIKDKEFKFLILIFVAFSPIPIYIFADYFLNNKLHEMKFIILFVILMSINHIKRIIKQRNSYIYFTNYQIFQRDNKEVFKEFKSTDVKSVRRSNSGFKGIKNDTPDHPIVAWIRDSLISKIWLFISCCCLAWFAFMSININNYMSFVYKVVCPALIFFISIIVIAYFLYPMFRLIDGRNSDIAENNILIQTENEHITLLNLTKQEFYDLQEYFRNFGLEITK